MNLIKNTKSLSVGQVIKGSYSGMENFFLILEIRGTTVLMESAPTTLIPNSNFAKLTIPTHGNTPDFSNLEFKTTFEGKAKRDGSGWNIIPSYKDRAYKYFHMQPANSPFINVAWEMNN